MKIQRHLKCYYKIHRSKSMNRKFVSGGPKLKSSGVYTEKFCEAVIEVWDMCYARGVEGFAGEYTLAVPYTQMWGKIFGHIAVDEAQGSKPHESVFFGMCLIFKIFDIFKGRLVFKSCAG